MRLKKIQEALKTKNIIFTYTEEDNCGSLDFQFRGLRYHIWEFVDGDIWGVETNVYHAGKSEDITGDYEKEISELILSWPIWRFRDKSKAGIFAADRGFGKVRSV